MDHKRGLGLAIFGWGYLGAMVVAFAGLRGWKLAGGGFVSRLAFSWGTQSRLLSRLSA
jgi:hypothetical protein